MIMGKFWPNEKDGLPKQKWRRREVTVSSLTAFPAYRRYAQPARQHLLERVELHGGGS